MWWLTTVASARPATPRVWAVKAARRAPGWGRLAGHDPQPARRRPAAAIAPVAGLWTPRRARLGRRAGPGTRKRRPPRGWGGRLVAGKAPPPLARRTRGQTAGCMDPPSTFIIEQHRNAENHVHRDYEEGRPGGAPLPPMDRRGPAGDPATTHQPRPSAHPQRLSTDDSPWPGKVQLPAPTSGPTGRAAEPVDSAISRSASARRSASRSDVGCR